MDAFRRGFLLKKFGFLMISRLLRTTCSSIVYITPKTKEHLRCVLVSKKHIAADSRSTKDVVPMPKDVDSA